MQDIPDENGLISDAQNDIIDQENSLSGTTFQATRSALYGVDSEGYHHPITPEIQACQNYDDIAKLFVVNGTSILDADTFGKLPLDIQKEAAEGIHWVMNTYGLNVLPSKVTTNVKGRSALGEYVDRTMEMRIRKTISLGSAFPTTVHEMTHHAINVLGIDVDDIVERARKQNKIQPKLGAYVDTRRMLAPYDDNNNEIVTATMERYSIGKIDTFWPLPKFLKTVAELFFGRLSK